MGATVVVHLKVNADLVGALLVFADVLEIELFVRPRFLFRRAIRIGYECLAPFHLREVIK
jgi:hypothetical protein